MQICSICERYFDEDNFLSRFSIDNGECRFQRSARFLRSCGVFLIEIVNAELRAC